MGKAALGICHADSAAAAAYVCGHSYPVPRDDGGQITCVGSAWNYLNLRYADPYGDTTTVQPQNTFPDCDAFTFTSGPGPLGLSYADGALIGAAVAGVWATAFVWRALRAALGGPRDTED